MAPPDKGNAPPVQAGGANQSDQLGGGSTGKDTLTPVDPTSLPGAS